MAGSEAGHDKYLFGATPMPLKRRQIAWRAAQDLADGAYVNLGIGLPTLVSDFIPEGREIVLHSENGILGVGPAPGANAVDPDLINAGKQPVTLVTGGSYVHHTDSFLMIRGGHLDLALLGAFEVSEKGDLANWTTDDPGFPPGVGGAMDLAVGAKEIRVLVEHTTKAGAPRIRRRCEYPLTAAAAVRRIYTDLAVIDVTPDGLAGPRNRRGHRLCRAAGQDRSRAAPRPGPAPAACPAALNGKPVEPTIRIAVLIPCYNEETTIASVVGDFYAALPDCSVYVYDNNSTDNTAASRRDRRGRSSAANRCRARAMSCAACWPISKPMSMSSSMAMRPMTRRRARQ